MIADLGVGLDDLGEGHRDIEIEDLRVLHQRGQLAGAEAAPPVQRRNGRIGWPLRRLAIRRGNLEIEFGPLGAEDAARQPRPSSRTAKRRASAGAIVAPDARSI